MYAKYVKLRDERGLTDYKVAKDTGIPRSALYEWGHPDKKKTTPKLDKIAKLANYFNVPIEYFVD